jgi:hypothetical protein
VIGGIASSAARVTVTMADQGTAIMAATPLLTADTPQRTTTAATLPHTTADIDRVTMLPPIMVPGTMALGTIGAGDRPARRLSRTTKGRRDVCDLFCARLGSVYDETRAGFKTVGFWHFATC